MKIAVVIATYNGMKFLPAQWESILAQSLPADEVIICDDASKDGTTDWIDGLAENERIRVYKKHENGGLIENFKTGISKVTEGHFISLSDQDDIWLPQKLEKCSQTLGMINSPDLPCLVYSDLMVIDDHETQKSPSFWNATGRGNYKHCLETLLFGNFVSGCTMLFNAHLGQFAKDIPAHLEQNHDAWLALAAFSMGKTQTIREPLVRYRQHDHNVTYSTQKQRPGLQNKLAKHWYFLSNPSQYLGAQFELVQSFYDTYQDHPLLKYHEQIRNFLSLQGKSYWKQKRAMRQVFKPYWH